MTHRLAPTTRVLALAVAGTAVVAAADLLDRDPTAMTAFSAIALLIAAGLLARAREVALTVTDGTVHLRGVLTSRTLPLHDVEAVVAGPWNSFVELRDGSAVMTLLRARDLEDLELPTVASERVNGPAHVVASLRSTSHGVALTL